MLHIIAYSQPEKLPNGQLSSYIPNADHLYVFLCPSSNGAEVNCNQPNPLFYAYLLNFHVGITAQKISFSSSITLRLETHCCTPFFFFFFLSVFCPDGAEGIYPHGQPGWLDWMRHSVKRWGWSLIPNSWSRLLTHWQVYPDAWGHRELKQNRKFRSEKWMQLVAQIFTQIIILIITILIIID